MSTHSYGVHELQKIKIWNYNPENKHTYIYIHGGAWRDPNNTYEELAPVAETTPGATFIGINYRLTSSKVKHPVHLADVTKAIVYIVTKFQLQEIHLLGYSVGATMILQLLQFKYYFNESFMYYKFWIMDKETAGESYDDSVFLELNEIEQKEDLINKLDKLIKLGKLTISSIKFLDGIYDLPKLLDEYPQYASWVRQAYPGQKLIQLTSLSNMTYQTTHALAPLTFDKSTSMIDKDAKLYIVHSLQDELLSLHQTRLFEDFLKNTVGKSCTVLTGDWGRHDDIYGDYRKEIFLYGEETS
ncbi:BNA7 [Candida theae]|uniref:Kynurenine formamidase n=1 Tax=Candida theae TaxID=1198502 RepID=A0AAD5BHM1_9ASCO|nr:BNA7 [Candida theae]KAI5964006.1 BNA7 [Candida theae]